MTSFRVLLVAVLLATASLDAQANAPQAALGCGQQCIGLIHEGQALEAQGKYQQALEHYKAAETANPQASLPMSFAGGLLLKLSSVAPKEKKEELRNTSRALAERAAKLAPDDPVAQEVLRMLDDDGPSPLRVASGAAARLMMDAEALFARHDLAGALEKYEAAMQADPQLSQAWVGAGDCHYAQRDFARAEALFRRATEIEPRNSQAWRFLSDALLGQGKQAAAEAALYAAIAADPSQRPNWGKLAAARAAAGMPLKALGLRRGVRVVRGADGKYTLNIDKPPEAKAASPDYAIWIALGMAEVNLRSADKAGTGSPFEIEVASWRQALKVVDELKANAGDELTNPALLQLQALARDGQLEAALLLLQFRQSWRPALEAWLAANPNGVKGFIDRYGLRP